MIYLDHAATTPLCKEALTAMQDALAHCFGNASSTYEAGYRSRDLIKKARKQVADLIGASPDTILFTSGGTESDNQALRCIARQKKSEGMHIITSQIEHHAILHAADYLEACGFSVTRLPVDPAGRVSAEQLEAAIRPDTILVSVMMANNEIGSLQPVRELAEVCHRHGVLFHTDAVQAFGQIPINVEELDVDLMSASAHKLYGPKGIGCLYVRKGLRLEPLLFGGGQEGGLRPGTENVPAIAGFGAAAQAAMEELSERAAKEEELRDYLIEKVLTRIPGSRLNGSRFDRLPGNSSFCFSGIEGTSLLLLLDLNGICASAGSACTASRAAASHVLKAIGVPDDIARGSLRLTLGKDTTVDELDETVDVLADVIEMLRAQTGESSCSLN